MQYTVVMQDVYQGYDEAIKRLSVRVERLMKDGWWPQGGIGTVSKANTPVQLMQAMIKGC